MNANKPIRTVMVGCGGMSGVWLKMAAAIEEIEIVGLADLNEDAAKGRAEEFGFPDAATSSDVRQLLKNLSPDAVFDCTVPEAHFDVTMAALDAGANVLGEKPMADTMDHARQMVAKSDETGKIYAVTQNRRYAEPIRRLRAFLAQNPIGSIATAKSDFYIGAHFGGFRDRMKHVLLLDMAIHTFDAARYITGADPIAVTCHEWNPPGSWYDHDANAVAVFEMTGGVVYTYCGSWCAEGLNTSWESDWRITGTNGSCGWDGAGDYKAVAVTKTEGFESELNDLEVGDYDTSHGATGAHEGLIREFVHCVRTGTAPETICTDNIKSLAMVFAAIESAETGQKVEINI